MHGSGSRRWPTTTNACGDVLKLFLHVRSIETYSQIVSRRKGQNVLLKCEHSNNMYKHRVLHVGQLCWIYFETECMQVHRNMCCTMM